MDSKETESGRRFVERVLMEVAIELAIPPPIILGWKDDPDRLSEEMESVTLRVRGRVGVLGIRRVDLENILTSSELRASIQTQVRDFVQTHQGLL